jgi:hypothetical protein
MAETMKLTPAQWRCLASVAAGAASREFDAVGGYVWKEGDFRTGWRKYEWDEPSPLSRLSKLGLIKLGPAERPYSGRQINVYKLTDAGRRALSEGGE